MSGILKLLVVANPSIESQEVRDAIVKRAAADAVHVTLVEPSAVGAGPLCAPRDADEAVLERVRRANVERLERAVLQLREAGVAVEGVVGGDLGWDPSRFDAVVVSCVPWLSFRTGGCECGAAAP